MNGTDSLIVRNVPPILLLPVTANFLGRLQEGVKLQVKLL